MTLFTIYIECLDLGLYILKKYYKTDIPNKIVSAIFYFIFLIILLITRKFWFSISNDKKTEKRKKFVEAVDFTVCLFIERNYIKDL